MHLITHYLFSGSIAQVIELPYLFYFIGLAILASALPFSLEMLALRNLTPLSFGTLMSSRARSCSTIWVYLLG